MLTVRLFHTPPPMDWLETPNAHVLKFDVPGFGKEEVKVQLEDGNVLLVKGEAKAKEHYEPKAAIFHVAERGNCGDFTRRVGLPDDVKTDNIKAAVENGVLTVVVPKEMCPPRPKSKNITVSSKL